MDLDRPIHAAPHERASPESRLRVLQVTPYFEDAWAYGGIPRAVTVLSRALAGRGHRVTVCTTDVRDGASRIDVPRAGSSRDSVDVRIFPNLSNRMAYDLQLFMPFGLGAFVRRHARDFDLAHIHGCHHLPGVIAARHLRRAGVPYVVSPHGTGPRIERRRVAKYVFDVTFGRRLLPGAARVVGVSEAERRQLRQLGVPDESIATVPNPIDVSEFEPVPSRGRFRERLGLGARPIVLFLGKLTPRKRLDVVVAAFAQLGRAQASLVIAGNDLGAGPSIRARIRDHRLEERVLLAGLLTGRERLEALTDADVVVYPGRHEVFGLVALEAIAVGTPVIVADDSGCAEVVRAMGGGRIVPEGSAAALAAAIGDALDARGERRSTARELALETYAASRIAGLVESLYRTVLEERAARAWTVDR